MRGLPISSSSCRRDYPDSTPFRRKLSLWASPKSKSIFVFCLLVILQFLNFIEITNYIKHIEHWEVFYHLLRLLEVIEVQLLHLLLLHIIKLLIEQCVAYPTVRQMCFLLLDCCRFLFHLLPNYFSELNRSSPWWHRTSKEALLLVRIRSDLRRLA